jgi:hypothetical protein
MALALLGVRLALAATFLAAAAGKIRHRPAFRDALSAFGAPVPSLGLLSVAIPAAELATGVGMLSSRTAAWAAILALALLAVFSAATARTLARGQRPACSCFGATHGEPIGAPTLARNAVLAAACALLVRDTGPGLDEAGLAWSAASADERRLLVSAAVLLGLLVAADRTIGRLRAEALRLTSTVRALEQRDPADSGARAPMGLPLGTPAPPFDLPKLEGDRASLGTLSQGRPVLLVFSDAYCPACGQLWPDIVRWQRDHADDVTVAVVCSGSPQTLEMKLMGHPVTNVLLAGDSRLGESYNLTQTPSAVLLDRDGRVASASATGVAAIRGLVAQAVGARV